MKPYLCANGGKITSIRRQKNHPCRVSVFIDGEFAFGIPEDVLLTYPLNKGDFIPPEKIKEVQLKGEHLNLKKKAYRLLGRREHTAYELRTKLFRTGCVSEEIDSILENLKQEKLVDDERFSRLWIKEKLERGKTGGREVEHQLLKKGVKPDVIKKVMREKWNDNAEVESAMNFISRKFSHHGIKNSPKNVIRDKIFAALYRKGWSYDTIKKAWDFVYENK